MVYAGRPVVMGYSCGTIESSKTRIFIQQVRALETVVGTNGLLVPPDGYLQSIRATCDKYGILLICDEVMAGFGRTGKWFACDHWDVVPDILTGAKGINSGYVPLGTMTVSEPIADWLKGYSFPGGLTYAGHPLACASGVAAIKTMQEEKWSW